MGRRRAVRRSSRCSPDRKLVGYAFVNADWVNSTGYSGQPIQILVGLTAEGKIAGARLMAHHEPIVLIGIPPERITKFIQGYVGRDVLKHQPPKRHRSARRSIS